jgi:hypothetical protein
MPGGVTEADEDDGEQSHSNAGEEKDRVAGGMNGIAEQRAFHQRDTDGERKSYRQIVCYEFFCASWRAAGFMFTTHLFPSKIRICKILLTIVSIPFYSCFGNI